MTDILLKVTLNTIKLTKQTYICKEKKMIVIALKCCAEVWLLTVSYYKTPFKNSVQEDLFFLA
jgi:hypothetical protein